MGGPHASTGQKTLHKRLATLKQSLAERLGSPLWTNATQASLTLSVCATEMATRTAMLLAQIEAINAERPISAPAGTDPGLYEKRMFGSGMLQSGLDLSALPLPENYRLSMLGNMAV